LIVAPLIAASRSFFASSTFLPHPAERGEQSRAASSWRACYRFQILEAVVANPDSHRTLAVFRIDVLLPEIGWFEDMFRRNRFTKSSVFISFSDSKDRERIYWRRGAALED